MKAFRSYKPQTITCLALLMAAGWLTAQSVQAMNQGVLTTPLQVMAEHPVINEFGSVVLASYERPLAERPKVVILQPGPGGPVPPMTNGAPVESVYSGGDTRMGAMVSPSAGDAGVFAATLADPRPMQSEQIFVRVYNASTIEDSLFYADSPVYTAPSNNTALYVSVGAVTNIIDPYRDSMNRGVPDWWQHLNYGTNWVNEVDPQAQLGDSGMSIKSAYIVGMMDPFADSDPFMITSVEPYYSGTNYADYVWTDSDDGSATFGTRTTTRVHQVEGSVIRWPSVGGRIYTIEYSTNLYAQGFVPLAEVPATPPENSYINTAITDPDVPVFYRARVRVAGPGE
jgi:hypothetical protein